MGNIYRKKKQALAILAAVMVGIIMLVGAIVWILSLEGIVIGFWASIMSVVFTFLGVLYGLLQWLAQLEEQQVLSGRGDLTGVSDSPVQGQKYSQSECLTSYVVCLPPAEVPSSTVSLSSSVVDNSFTVALREVSVMNGAEQNSSLPQKGVNIHIYICQDTHSSKDLIQK